MHDSSTWTALITLALLTGCPASDDDSGADDTDTGTSGGMTTETSSTGGSGGSTAATTGTTTDTTTGTDTDADTDTDTESDPDTGSDSSTGGFAGCGMPTELGITDLGEFDMDGFHVEGTRIAVAIRGDGVALLDAADPANVTLLGSFDPDGGPTYRAALQGDTIVGGRRGGGAFMVDATDPGAMTELWVDGDLDTQDILLEGDTLYLASAAGISVVDVAALDAPNVLVEDLQQDAADANIGGSTLAKEEDTLFMAGFNFTAIDVSAPQTPTTLAEVDDTGRPDNLVSAGGFVYVGGNDGVQIFDLSDPAAPVLTGTYDAERASLLALDAEHDRLFVFGSSTASTDVPLLRIVDVTDKAIPVEVGTMYEELDDPLWAQYEDGALYFTTDATDPPSLYILDGCPPL